MEIFDLPVGNKCQFHEKLSHIVAFMFPECVIFEFVALPTTIITVLEKNLSIT